jgi:hypothetical protein
MALMSTQPISSVLTPTFSAPTTSDTISWESGLLLYVKVGGTATTVTVVIPGNQPYSGTATSDLSTGSITSTERVFHIPRDAVDTTTNLVTVTYSQVTGVTAALFKH